jgi:hypothetical protein
VRIAVAAVAMVVVLAACGSDRDTATPDDRGVDRRDPVDAESPTSSLPADVLDATTAPDQTLAAGGAGPSLTPGPGAPPPDRPPETTPPRDDRHALDQGLVEALVAQGYPPVQAECIAGRTFATFKAEALTDAVGHLTDPAAVPAGALAGPLSELIAACTV